MISISGARSSQTSNILDERQRHDVPGRRGLIYVCIPRALLYVRDDLARDKSGMRLMVGPARGIAPGLAGDPTHRPARRSVAGCGCTDSEWPLLLNSANWRAPIYVRLGSTIEFREEELLLLRSGYVR